MQCLMGSGSPRERAEGAAPYSQRPGFGSPFGPANVGFVLVRALPPLILAGVYGLYGCLASPPRDHPELAASMNATALVCVLLGAAVVLAFATVLGVHVALRTANSQLAIIHALSTIFFLTVGTLICIALILINGQFEYQWGSFVFFLIAGVGGLWYVLSADRPSAALTWARPGER